MSLSALPRHQRPTKLKTFLFGAPYYPEHWTAEDRRDDPARMAAAGVNVVRMAEFAWDLMEPERGKFDFTLFDETIARLGKVGISTILCTPTAAPPRWLTAGHDDWMRVDADGRRMVHGSRQHACTTNDEFRAESRRITRAMAEHFAGNPHVAGWQTDNELHCHFNECYCPACVKGFQEWLRAKYVTLDALNAAWGTAFWAQTYADFAHVLLPYPNRRPAPCNPSHQLDYYRFLSDQCIEFQRQQVDILREVNPKWWITQNGLMPHIDYWKFTSDLDFLGVDAYQCFGTFEPDDFPAWSHLYETCRSATGGFVVPEQQGGASGQIAWLSPVPQPGQMRLWAWQGIAHGADGVLHFRWRTCRFGAEEYWCGILDHDNVPRRRYEEFSREGHDLARVGAKVLGTTLDVKAALLADQDQNEAHRTSPLQLPSPFEQSRTALSEMLTRHLPCGVVDSSDSFAGLELVWVPSMPLMDDALAAKLRAFAEAGGVLVMTARSATRRRNNQVFNITPPALLTDLFGASVEEFSHVKDALTMTLGGKRIAAGTGYEILLPTSAKVLAKWNAPDDRRPHAAKGKPAVTINRVGKGVAIYVGTFLSSENVAAIVELALAHTTIKPLAKCDDFVEVTRRRSDSRALTFLLNHYPRRKQVRALPRGTELLTGKSCRGTITLRAWEVAVIEEA